MSVHVPFDCPAGTLSDVFVRRAKKAGSQTGLVGVRVRLVLIYGIFTALALLAFSVCPNMPAIQWASIAAVGFGLYGPQMLIGLCGAEVRMTFWQRVFWVSVVCS